ncbi:MAG: MATE family efflux transporter [Clostridia bacterium]|nr:MATE family efflux transporter [Clostridia bacterium]
MNAGNKRDRMGTMPVGRLLAVTAVPMMISMLVQALYNVVDSLYVSRVSQEALNAVSMAFPLQTLMIGVGIGTAVGTNALLSRHLGEKRTDLAERSANTGLLLSIATSLVFALIGIAFSGVYFKSINSASFRSAELIGDELERAAEIARVQSIVDYGTAYCTVCLSFSMGFFLQATFERMLTATNRSHLAMICQVCGALTNIVLDPVFIFGKEISIFGAHILTIPAFEVKGAAIATVIGQFVAGGLAMIFVLTKVREVRIRVREIRWHTATVKMIYKIGLPSIIMQCVGSVMNYCMNLILITFTDTATAFFGVYYKLQSFVFMPVFGLNNGMVPIISYNYGARQPERLWKTVKLSLAVAITIMSLGCLVFELMPETLMKLFHASGELTAMGRHGLRIIGVHFPIAAYCIIMGSVFQAVGDPNHSMLTSICRQLLVLLPATWLLSRLGNVDYVWFAFPIAEIVSCTLSTVFLRSTIKKLNAEIGSPKTELAEA